MVDKLLARRKSILELVRGEVTDLRGRVGSREREARRPPRSVKSVESGFQGAMGCARPAGAGDRNPTTTTRSPTIGKAQMDLLVLALACGMTKRRFGPVESHTVGPAVFSWLGIGDGHHSLSHSDDGNAKGVADFVAGGAVVCRAVRLPAG